MSMVPMMATNVMRWVTTTLVMDGETAGLK